jgi:hypothetical protein
LLLKSGLAVAGFVAVIGVAFGVASAAPLDAAACDAATAEQSQLSDVPAIIERGPEWAKNNAPPQTLQRVARWIELQEQLSFRCGRGRVTAEAQRAAAAAELIENPQPPALAAVPAGSEKPAVAKDAVAPVIAAPAATETAKPKAAKAKLKSKPKSAPKEAPVATEAGAPPASDGDVPAVPAKKKRAAKPVDAFVPPASTQTN